MVILTTFRQSPAYLYLKSYSLCALVSLFQTNPVSSRLSRLKGSCHLARLPEKPRRGELGEKDSDRHHFSRVLIILKRWQQRALDLSQIKHLLRRDDNDLKTYPEVNLDASVRRSCSLHQDEQMFIRARRHRISCQGNKHLHSLLGLAEDEVVDPQDVPLIALGGSGGGYRAMYGFAAFISGAKKMGLWDCLTWTAGVSGSCWTLAGYYTFAGQSVSKLIQHYLSVARELTHPLSLRALNTVARSSQGVYFLLGPLIRKTGSPGRDIGLVVMDLYATLTTTYQFLSRQPGAKLSRATFQFSRVWKRAGLDQGAEPMPILTAVRRAPPNEPGVEPHADSSISRGRPPERAMKQHESPLSTNMPTYGQMDCSPNAQHALDSSLANGFFQWIEISPLEVGNADIQAYVPTWSWGRAFQSGKSINRFPEQSLSLILGQCTSAPAGPVTGYISALLASLPQATLMSRFLLLLNKFARMKQWKNFWGNPIRAGHDPNPFHGHEPGWERQTKIRLMDGGMSNNLPNHVLARPERAADIIISFDTSSDVQTGAAVRRMHNFAKDCSIHFEDVTALFDPPRPRTVTGGIKLSAAAIEVEKKFLHMYARVFHGRREDGQELYIVYCSLLPNAVRPEFDPSVRSSPRASSNKCGLMCRTLRLMIT